MLTGEQFIISQFGVIIARRGFGSGWETVVGDVGLLRDVDRRRRGRVKLGALERVLQLHIVRCQEFWVENGRRLNVAFGILSEIDIIVRN